MLSFKYYNFVGNLHPDSQYEIGNKFIGNLCLLCGVNAYDELGDIDPKLSRKAIEVDEMNKKVNLIKPINLLDAIVDLSKKELFKCIGAVVCEKINIYISDIRPAILCNLRTQFTGIWKSPRLLFSMNMELFLMFSQNAKIRKCRNATYTKYFEITGNDLRKIYCCSDCARLEAKRKERARKKV